MKNFRSYLICFFLFICLQSYSQKTPDPPKTPAQNTEITRTVEAINGSTIAKTQSAKGSNYTISWGENTIVEAYDIDTSFTFNGEDRTVKLNFIISEDSDELYFQATGSIKGGSLKLFLIDPKGKKHPGFTLKAKGDGSAKGVVTEVNDDILKGKWSIEVKNNNSTGNLVFKIGQK